MTEPLYIWIPNWDGPTGFQHYKNRDPKWIKCYTRLLSHDAYMDLTFSRRGILHGIWLEYASSARRLRGDTLSLTRRLGQKVTRRDIESLQQAGFIELLASSVLAERYHLASLEVEEEEELPSLPPTEAKDPIDPDVNFTPTENGRAWQTDHDLQPLGQVMQEGGIQK